MAAFAELAAGVSRRGGVHSTGGRTVVTTFLLAAALAACGGAANPNPAPLLVSIGAGLDGPAGLTATVYAHSVQHAAAFALDSQGRLWVATAGYTDTGTDALYMVSAAAATPLDVIPQLHTPLGLLWDGDSLYVASQGGVAAYTGFDGAHFGARRVIVALPAGVGEVNNIVLAPDGRMLLGITAPCDHCTPLSHLSASIISFRPDGSDLQTYASGIRAPVGLTLYPGTSDLFVTMNQRDDLGDRTPGDWLAVVSAGQSWGFPACYGQGGAVCKGVPQPVAVLDRHAAVDGVQVVTGQLGTRIGTSALVAEWSDGVIQDVALHPVGTTYSGTAAPIITGLKMPVPLLLGPSHDLFVGDWATGIVYRIAAA